MAHVAHGQTSDAQQYLAMEWLEGEDLCQLLQEGPLSVHATMQILQQVASALAHAHAHGVLHRDLNPSNIFLIDGMTEQVKILDFGIARRMQASQVMTRTGMLVGAPDYMAP